MQEKNNNSETTLSLIIESIEDVKGLNLNLLDLRAIENTVFDFFVICTGTSNTHVNAIVSSIQKGVSKKLSVKPLQVEGTQNAEWVLMDYADIVVHVFQKQIREKYDIEGLWGDAELTVIPSSVTNL